MRSVVGQVSDCPSQISISGTVESELDPTVALEFSWRVGAPNLGELTRMMKVAVVRSLKSKESWVLLVTRT